MMVKYWQYLFPFCAIVFLCQIQIKFPLHTCIKGAFDRNIRVNLKGMSLFAGKYLLYVLDFSILYLHLSDSTLHTLLLITLWYH